MAVSTMLLVIAALILTVKGTKFDIVQLSIGTVGAYDEKRKGYPTSWEKKYKKNDIVSLTISRSKESPIEFHLKFQQNMGGTLLYLVNGDPESTKPSDPESTKPSDITLDKEWMISGGRIDPKKGVRTSASKDRLKIEFKNKEDRDKAFNEIEIITDAIRVKKMKEIEAKLSDKGGHQFGKVKVETYLQSHGGDRWVVEFESSVFSMSVHPKKKNIELKFSHDGKEQIYYTDVSDKKSIDPKTQWIVDVYDPEKKTKNVLRITFKNKDRDKAVKIYKTGIKLIRGHYGIVKAMAYTSMDRYKRTKAYKTPLSTSKDQAVYIIDNTDHTGMFIGFLVSFGSGSDVKYMEYDSDWRSCRVSKGVVETKKKKKNHVSIYLGMDQNEGKYLELVLKNENQASKVVLHIKSILSTQKKLALLKKEAEIYRGSAKAHSEKTNYYFGYYDDQYDDLVYDHQGEIEYGFDNQYQPHIPSYGVIFLSLFVIICTCCLCLSLATFVIGYYLGWRGNKNEGDVVLENII